jgi:hypothetical protein
MAPSEIISLAWPVSSWIGWNHTRPVAVAIDDTSVEVLTKVLAPKTL